MCTQWHVTEMKSNTKRTVIFLSFVISFEFPLTILFFVVHCATDFWLCAFVHSKLCSICVSPSMCGHNALTFIYFFFFLFFVRFISFVRPASLLACLQLLKLITLFKQLLNLFFFFILFSDSFCFCFFYFEWNELYNLMVTPPI